MLQRIEQSVAFITERTDLKPVVAIILGSGLGSFANELSITLEIPYGTIPHFPISTVEGHQGTLLFGYYRNIPLVLMQGRIHYYEGVTMQELTFPVRVFKNLGVKILFLTNAAGGMNPNFNVGNLMIINDHINLMPNPLIGKFMEQSGSRFSARTVHYDRKLIALADSVSKELKIEIKHGVYIGVTGPTYETPAEYACFRLMGGDAVGMSTTPEVIVAKEIGMRCFAISVITDLGVKGRIKYITHQLVQEAAMTAEPNLAKLIKEMLVQLQGPF
jgi:purine-nucleoside phosphorylase